MIDTDDGPNCSRCGAWCYWNEDADRDDESPFLCNNCAQTIAHQAGPLLAAAKVVREIKPSLDAAHLALRGAPREASAGFYAEAKRLSIAYLEAVEALIAAAHSKELDR